MKLRNIAIGAAALALPFGLSTASAGAAQHKVKVPASCKAEIKTYNQILLLASQGFTIAANYPAQYGPIATAVQNNDAATLNTIVAKVKNWNSQIQALTKKIGSQKAVLNAENTRCLAGK